MNILPRHWEKKPTYIFKLPDGRILIKNGCQTFFLKDLDRVCAEFDVPADVKQKVLDNIPVRVTYRLPKKFKDTKSLWLFFDMLPLELALRWYVNYRENWPDMDTYYTEKELLQRVKDPAEAYALFGNNVDASIRKMVCEKQSTANKVRLFSEDPHWAVRVVVAQAIPVKRAMRLFGQDPHVRVIRTIAWRMPNDEAVATFAKHTNPEVRRYLVRRSTPEDAFVFFRDDPVEDIQMSVLALQETPERMDYFLKSTFSEVRTAAKRQRGQVEERRLDAISEKRVQAENKIASDRFFNRTDTPNPES